MTQEKKQPEALSTIKGWVARDDDTTLTFFFTKPKRACYTEGKLYFENELKEGMTPWIWAHKDNISDNEYILLPSTLFPKLTWEDNPIEVELIIKPL